MKLTRAALFVLLTATLFVAALAASARVRVGEDGGATLLAWFCHADVAPGDRYHSLRRFREASARGHVDVVVLGSSHAYRGYDPRIFEKAGLSMMNLGSTNQTPLNSYYVAERYLPALAPKTVIVELYAGSLASDGVESARDLVTNTPVSWPLAAMTLRTWNLDTMTLLAAKALGLVADDARAEQAAVPGETYVPGGYCESGARRPALAPGERLPAAIAAGQLDWLALLTARAKARGARVVWVSHPLPADQADRIANRAELRAEIEAAARRAGAPYWDFQDTLALDPLADFQDTHHLNAAGVARFDEAVLARLRDER